MDAERTLTTFKRQLEEYMGQNSHYPNNFHDITFRSYAVLNPCAWPYLLVTFLLNQTPIKLDRTLFDPHGRPHPIMDEYKFRLEKFLEAKFPQQDAIARKAMIDLFASIFAEECCDFITRAMFWSSCSRALDGNSRRILNHKKQIEDKIQPLREPSITP
jgi:hypothetical protein